MKRTYFYLCSWNDSAFSAKNSAEAKREAKALCKEGPEGGATSAGYHLANDDGHRFPLGMFKKSGGKVHQLTV